MSAHMAPRTQIQTPVLWWRGACARARVAACPVVSHPVLPGCVLTVMIWCLFRDANLAGLAVGIMYLATQAGVCGTELFRAATGMNPRR